MIEINLFIGVMILAFLCEFIDSSLGMGYGTAATPILILIGFPVLDIVPAVLLSELITGLLSGLAHHSIGNVNFSLRSLHTRVLVVLSICSILGTVIAVAIAINLPKNILNLYIGLLVLIMGIIVFATRNKTFKFSWKKIITLGSIAAFNKGMSGGGYGPVVMSGQVLSGVNDKSAVGITSVSEGLTSAVGLVTFICLGSIINLELAMPMVIGATFAVPIAAYTTKRISSLILKRSIALLTIVLGLITIIKLFI